jgi:hypothetical protein
LLEWRNSLTKDEVITITRVDLRALAGDRGAWDALVEQLEYEAVYEFDKRGEPVAISDGDETSETTRGRLLIGMVLAEPLIQAGLTPCIGDMELGDALTGNGLSARFNSLLDRVTAEVAEPDYKALNESIARTLRRLSELSGYCNVRAGNTISVWSLIQLMESNKEFDDLIHLKIPEGLQFSEIEDFLNNEKLGRLVEMLKEEDTCLRPYIRSATGINTRQLSQAIMNVGLKPDLFGNVIEHPIDTNFLVGMRDIRDYFVLSIGARKAQITNFKQVKDAGYLTRKLSLLMIDTDLDRGNEDCGTQYFLECEVEARRTLQRIAGRRYAGADGLLHPIFATDTHLIGETLLIRSPITCASHSGVCKTCYGEGLAELNSDIHAGIFAMTYLTNSLAS